MREQKTYVAGLISVIIPVFNTSSRYLDECLESIVSQGYENIEVVLVDDGSTNPSTLRCLESWKDNCPFVTVINKANTGVSDTRNVGMAAARGEYIMFVDSDDVLFENACESLLQVAKNSGCDVVVGCFEDIADDDTASLSKGDPFSQLAFHVLDEAEMYQMRQAILAYRTMDYLQKGISPDSPWAKLFRHDMLDRGEVLFPVELSRSEDALFCLYSYEYAQGAFVGSPGVAFVDKRVYGHRMNPDSLVESCSDNSVRMLPLIIEAKKRFCSQYYQGDASFEKACCLRALEGIKESCNKYFFHPANRSKQSVRKAEFAAFLADETIRECVRQLDPSDIASKGDRVRLSLLKAGRYTALFNAETAWRKLRG